MITNYKHPNEIAYCETKTGVYRIDEIMTFTTVSEERLPQPVEDNGSMVLINQKILEERLNQDKMVLGEGVTHGNCYSLIGVGVTTKIT